MLILVDSGMAGQNRKTLLILVIWSAFACSHFQLFMTHFLLEAAVPKAGLFEPYMKNILNCHRSHHGIQSQWRLIWYAEIQTRVSKTYFTCGSDMWRYPACTFKQKSLWKDLLNIFSFNPFFAWNNYIEIEILPFLSQICSRLEILITSWNAALISSILLTSEVLTASLLRFCNKEVHSWDGLPLYRKGHVCTQTQNTHITPLENQT